MKLASTALILIAAGCGGTNPEQPNKQARSSGSLSSTDPLVSPSNRWGFDQLPGQFDIAIDVSGTGTLVGPGAAPCWYPGDIMWDQITPTATPGVYSGNRYPAGHNDGGSCNHTPGAGTISMSSQNSYIDTNPWASQIWIRR